MIHITDDTFERYLNESKSWHELTNKVFGYSGGDAYTLAKNRALQIGLNVEHLIRHRLEKTCEKCNIVFFQTVKINGKIKSLNKRKYCLICSPFGKNNRRNLNGDNSKRCKYNLSDIEKVKKEYDDGLSIRQISKKMKIGKSTIRKWIDKGYIKPRNASDAMKLAAKYKKPFSDESKRKMSNSRKKLLQERPELHPNRILAGNRNKMSFPERLAFDYLTNENISFKHNAKIGKYFVDFLIGDIAIEIDGERWHDAQKDAIRDEKISLHGIKIFRFKAKEVLKNPSIINIFNNIGSGL